MNRADLTVFVTELARRQFVRREVLANSFVDASRLLTMTRLREMCVQSARQAGLLRGDPLSDVRRSIIVRRAAEAARAEFAGGGHLGSLSASALADTLDTLVETLSPFGDDAEAIHTWLLARKPAEGKLRQLGLLYGHYRRLGREAGVTDTRDINAAVLRLLKGDSTRWPHLLQHLQGALIFRSIRWLNPFEEQLVAALKTRLGDARVRIALALPPAHADKMQDRLASRIRSDVMMGAGNEWTGWAEDLSDALEVTDPNLAVESRERLDFSRSVGQYGEIEDLARRIRWEIDHRHVAPERIALVVRNVGDYADAITHVFERFGIPCFFRRGLPASSLPLVKNILSLLSFPLGMERDRFCALLQSPVLKWNGFASDEERRQAAFEIAASGTAPRISAENVASCLERYSRAGESRIPPARFPAVLRAISAGLKRLRSLAGSATLADHARNALALIADFRADPARTEPSPAHAGNLRALEAMEDTLREIAAATADDSTARGYAELLDLLQKSLDNATVAPGHMDENGVWVLNPFDAAGLRFDVVLIAGLNEGVFPSVPRQDSLFSDAERQEIRRNMEKQGIHLPMWALPESAVRSIQESTLFLIALGAARSRLVLSHMASDTDGRDLIAGDFFRSVWNLAGWPADPAIALNEYDRWRMEILGHGSHFSRHVKKQEALPAYQRTPMPGESYLATVPLPLCRAADEARQRITHAPESELRTLSAERRTPNAEVARAIADNLRIEQSRERFFNTPSDQRLEAEPYCGKLAGEFSRALAQQWMKKHDEFSPTAMEVLARCRYRFLLAQMAHIGALRVQEETPDVMDRGRIIHEILRMTYSSLAGATNGLDASIARRFAALCKPRAWAVQDAKGRWVLNPPRPSGTPPKEGISGPFPSTGGVANGRGGSSIPLVSFNAADAVQYGDFAEAVADLCFRQAEESGETVRLGDPGIWETEKPKIRRIVRNYVLLDAEFAAGEKRFPALFELRFGRQFDREEPDAPALVLQAAGSPLAFHGQIDRVDLIFDDHGALSKLLVIDYKGTSRGSLSEDEYTEEIAENLNCQLPIYAFVAQQFLFGRHNEPGLNEMTEAVYHIQDRSYDNMRRQFTNRRIRLGLASEEGPPIMEAFTGRLAANIAKISSADFSVDPLDCTYCDFNRICRVDVNALTAAKEND